MILVRVFAGFFSSQPLFKRLVRRDSALLRRRGQGNDVLTAHDNNGMMHAQVVRGAAPTDMLLTRPVRGGNRCVVKKTPVSRVVARVHDVVKVCGCGVERCHVRLGCWTKYCAYKHACGWLFGVVVHE